MNYWLMKTEPGEFSYADLERAGREPWNGVRNPTAQKHLRSMKPGDLTFIYHTGGERAIVGIGRIVSEACPDPAAGDSRYVMVDVVPEQRLERPVTLAGIKADGRFSHWELVRQSRLSVMPVNEMDWGLVLDMGRSR